MTKQATTLEGIKTPFYQDVKLEIKAGMPFGNKKGSSAKIKVVGFEVTRLYFDTAEMDWQVGSQRIKRVIQ